MTDPERAARLRPVLVVIPAIIAMVFGEQIGCLASLTSDWWPRNAAGAVFPGVFSTHALQVALFACWPLCGFMFLVDKYGSRTFGEQLALVRTMVAKDTIFVLWMGTVTGALLWLPIVAPLVRFIGAIKSPKRQASVLAPVALLAGFCVGAIITHELPVKFFCDDGGALILRSGERLACVTVGLVQRQKFWVVRGPEATSLVWPVDVEPATLRQNFSPVAADYLARLTN